MLSRPLGTQVRKFTGEARKGDQNFGAISTFIDSKATRLNEITKGISVKRNFQECALGFSKARGQEKTRGQPRLF